MNTIVKIPEGKNADKTALRAREQAIRDKVTIHIMREFETHGVKREKVVLRVKPDGVIEEAHGGGLSVPLGQWVISQMKSEDGVGPASRFAKRWASQAERKKEQKRRAA